MIRTDRADIIDAMQFEYILIGLLLFFCLVFRQSFSNILLSVTFISGVPQGSVLGPKEPADFGLSGSQK